MKGEEVEVHFDWNPPFLTARARVRGRVVGYAYVTVEGAEAELSDIYIYEDSPEIPVWQRKLRRLLRVWSGRGRGWGSELLDQVCKRASELGAARIHGEMQGDLERLARWYGRQGFEVDPTTRRVEKELVWGTW